MKNIDELRLTKANDKDLFTLVKDRCGNSNQRFDYYFEDWDKLNPIDLERADHSQEEIRWRIIDKGDHREIGVITRMHFVENIILTFNESEPAENERVHDIFEDFKKELKFIGYNLETSPNYVDHLAKDDRGRKIYVPTVPAALERWKRAYRLIKRKKKEVKQFHDDLESEKVNPTLADYQETLADEMSWKPSERTISRICKAGNFHLLD